jgi:aminopeptidase N
MRALPEVAVSLIPRLLAPILSIGLLATPSLPAATPSGSSVTTPAPVPHPKREVLPDRVVPLHYDLSLAPDAEALTFTGKVAITIEVRSAGPSVTLNAVGLTFDHARDEGGADAVVTLDEKLGRATLRFGRALAPGQHTLVIDYHGVIGHSTIGFFAMDYRSPDGPRRTLATNFEPASARQLLPCWDEPGRKATFAVTVDAPKDRLALSNMPVAEVTSLSPTRQRVRFATTPKMSSYLLFLAIGDYERVHATVDGVDLGVVVKRGDAEKAGYALEQAPKILHYYNDYFGIAYPLPKLDLIAAPGEIQGGSMENWGAIFYSQNHVLFDPKTSTEQDRQVVFLVLAHEMAHQWFGDLVTMAWWDDLWLNEGFARWMQTFAADDLHPEWQTGLQAAAIYEQGKQADSVPSTHPVVQEVDTADQAEESFDAITYDKGAAIITMLNAYAGREKFRDGVRRYMRAHAFGNTVDTDLWRPMQQAVGLPIVGIERDFTRQEGLPLVRVTGGTKGVHLVQSRFADDPASLEHVPPQRWRLPLAAGASEGAHPYVLLQGAADVPELPPVLVNAGQMGYARVLYDEPLFDGLAARMAVFPPADQLGLMNDARAFGLAGDAPASQLLKLIVALPPDANPRVWENVLTMLADIEDHYGDGPERTAYRRFCLALLAPLAARLGTHDTPGESSNDQILRSRLAIAQGRFGDAAVIEAARQRVASGEGTPAEQRTALDIAAARADPQEFDRLLARAESTADPLQKQQLFRALAGVMDPGLARRMIDIALGTEVPAGAAPNLLARLARWHPDLAWETVAPRLDDANLPLSKSMRWRIAGAVAGFSAKPERIADLDAYEQRAVPPEARKPFLESVASIRQNARIVTRVLPDIDRWIAARSGATSGLGAT